MGDSGPAIVRDAGYGLALDHLAPVSEKQCKQEKFFGQTRSRPLIPALDLKDGLAKRDGPHVYVNLYI